MHAFAAVDFGFAREVLQRGIALVYAIAFVSSWNQFPALAGEHGLVSAPRLLAWARARTGRPVLHPTLFRHVRYTDRRLRALCAAGVVVALALAAGIPQWGPPWVPMACFLAIWLGYLSIVSIGQTFYAFGWEMLLLEAGALAAFLGSDRQPAPTAVIVLFWWLAFRVEFGAGMIKIRGGREWRDLSALTYHHETQPMPGPLSRQAHLLPRWFHRVEAVANHVGQLAVPWLLFAPIVGLWMPGPVPALVGAGAAAVVIATQLWLIVTGNYAWLNWLTIVVATGAVGVPGLGAGAAVPASAAGARGATGGIPLPWLVVTGAVAAGYVVLSIPAARNLASRRQRMNASFNRWQLANAYGAFGTVTRERIEYVVEGTTDADPTTALWHEYAFRGKPGATVRIPPPIAPYHLRLDWLMWFLPLGYDVDDWFLVFLRRLLEADRPTLRLLRTDPFDGRPPRFVRVVAYRYRFATRAQFRADRRRWVRDRRRIVVRPRALPGG